MNTKKFFFILLSMLWLWSCDDFDNNSLPIESLISVEFDSTQVTVPKNVNELSLTLTLSQTAIKDGSITIVPDVDFSAQFTTEPELINNRLTLVVAKGVQQLNFKIRPIHNNETGEDFTVRFSLASVSQGLQIGAHHSLLVSVLDDEEPTIQPVEANFLVSQNTTSENATEGSIIAVSLSGPAPAPGMIDIVFSSNNLIYGADFVTEPAAENNKINLTVTTGSSQVSYKVIPINNELFNGDRGIVFTLTNGDGSVRLGQSVALQLSITDDEPAPKMKSYETISGEWKVRRLYEYGADDKLVKVTWEQYTPSYQGGTYTYEYHQGRLHKMMENVNRETYYLWEGDRIVKEEQFTNGLLTKYVLYHYDEAGNIGEAAFHYKQPDGSLKLGLLNVYLYNTDGNLYKKMVYNPIDGSDEHNLISTITFDDYLDVENPFPLEILPNVNPQPKLPGTYLEEANGNNTLYLFTYEFDGSGRPLKRKANSSIGSETTTYSYH